MKRFLLVFFFIFFIFLILFIFSCQKDELLPSKGYEDVTLKAMGPCVGGYIFITNSNNISLEPMNLNDFTVSYKDGDKFWLKYKIAKDQMSICMMGDIINIVELKPQ